MDDEKLFFEELSSFELDMPGGRRVPFRENKTLLQMLRNQYPRWPNSGNVTSVPTARIPRLFLHNVQMSSDMQKEFGSLQKGEIGEIKVYKMLLNSSDPDREGIIVFPNINGRELFKTTIAHVEIDTVLIHPSKGVFVFNIKKQGGKGLTPQKIINDMQNHGNFVRLLLQYGQDESKDNPIPIHNVLCTFHDDNKGKFRNLQPPSNMDATSKTLIFTKTDLKTENFGATWSQQLSQIGDIQMGEQLEVLVARLVALNSLEGSLALIHNQMSMNFMQTVSKRSQSKYIQQVQQAASVDEIIKEKLTDASHAQRHGSEKKRFIIWTNDQLNIISTVFQRLVQVKSSKDDKANKKGLRLIVTGCKGSGKTMLLTFIAKMAQCLFEDAPSSSATAKAETPDKEGSTKVLVCDGSFSSPVLTTLLQTMLSSTAISVYTTPVGQDFRTLQTFEEEKAKIFHDLFKRQLQPSKLLLCDEFRHVNHEYLLGDLREDQHCVLFASNKDETLDSSYQHIHLGASLRSTCKIAQFADGWIKGSSLQNFEFECKPAHNFDGERPDIRTISQQGYKSETDIVNLFIEESVSSIVEYAERSKGLELVPVVPFIDSESRQKVLEGLEARGLECRSPSYSYSSTENNGESKQDPTRVSRSSLPTICFFKEADIEGAEFGIVVVLMHHKKPQDIRADLGLKFFTAVTRASTKLVLVIAEGGNNEFTHCDSSGKANSANAGSLSELIELKIAAKTPTILVGPLTHFEGLRSISEVNSRIKIPKIEGVNVFLGPNDETIFQIDDVYKKEDLEALQTFGIRLLVFLKDSSGCEWRFKFFFSSYLCTEAFIKDRKNAFKLCNLLVNYADVLDELQCLEKFIWNEKNYGRASHSDIRTERNPFLAPLPTEDLFRWENWEQKGHEHNRLGHNILAADKYMQSILFLEPQYQKHKTELQIDAACEERKELAKLCTHVSMMYLQHLRSPSDGRQDVCSRDRYINEIGSTYESCIVTAFDHAINAAEWNACWKLSYVIIRDTIEMIKKRASATGQEKTPTEESRILQELVRDDIERKGIREIKFRPTFSFDGRRDIEDAEVMKYSYKIQITNLTEQNDAIENLTAIRKRLSKHYVSVAETSLGQIKKYTNPTKLLYFMLTFREVRQLFDYSVRFAIEALEWNPSEVSANNSITQSLIRLEDSVTRLERIADNYEEPNFLSEIVKDEIQYG